MILAYLHKQELVFLENSYWDKGKRLGNLIQNPASELWEFWPERGEGVSAKHMLTLTSKLYELNKVCLGLEGHCDPAQPSLGIEPPKTPPTSHNQS